MEFITFIEHNHKELERFIFYLQWTGNEEPLTWLHKTVNRSCSGMEGDYSDFEMDIDVKFTEEMVDQHCKLNYGSYSRMFQKVVGHCMMWKGWRRDVEKMTEEEVANWLDRKFFGCCIGGLFETSTEKFKKQLEEEEREEEDYLEWMKEEEKDNQ